MLPTGMPSPLNCLVLLNTSFWICFNLCCSSQNRKRTAGEIGSGSLGGIDPGGLRNSKAFRQDDMVDRQADGVHGDSSASHECHAEAVACLISSNPTTSDPSEPHKVKHYIACLG